jgi:hypothetical protein
LRWTFYTIKDAPCNDAVPPVTRDFYLFNPVLISDTTFIKDTEANDLTPLPLFVF